MGRSSQSEQSHSPEHGDAANAAPSTRVALDGFRLLYGPLAIAFLVLLFVPLTASGRSMVDPLLAKSGGDLLIPLLQVLLVVLLVMANFRPRSGTLPTVIAGVSAGWLLLFAIGMVVGAPTSRLSVGRFAVVALMVGTLALVTTHVVLNRRRARADRQIGPVSPPVAGPPARSASAARGRSSFR